MPHTKEPFDDAPIVVRSIEGTFDCIEVIIYSLPSAIETSSSNYISSLPKETTFLGRHVSPGFIRSMTVVVCFHKTQAHAYATQVDPSHPFPTIPVYPLPLYHYRKSHCQSLEDTTVWRTMSAM